MPPIGARPRSNMQTSYSVMNMPATFRRPFWARLQPTLERIHFASQCSPKTENQTPRFILITKREFFHQSSHGHILLLPTESEIETPRIQTHRKSSVAETVRIQSPYLSYQLTGISIGPYSLRDSSFSGLSRIG